MVGAHFGVTPKKYQLARRTIPAGSPRSATPVSGPRSMSAAHVILTPPVKGSDLKTWALGVAKHAGLRKAAVTLARKLAVVLHRMLRDQTDFAAHQAKPMMAA
jgi:transposase